MAVGAGYEVVEWLSDTLAGTHFVKSVDDTGSDLLEDTLGSLAGATLVTVWSIRHWATRRRAPSPATAPPVLATLRRRLRRRVVPQVRSRTERLPAALKGVVGLVVGVLVLAWPSPTLRTVEILFAVAMLAHAALDLVDEVRDRDEPGRARRLAVVALEVTIATVLLSWPTISRVVLLRAIGASAILIGLLEAASLSASRTAARERWLSGAASAAAFVFGVAFLAFPDRGFDAVVSVVGLYLASVGGLRVIRAVESRLTGDTVTR